MSLENQLITVNNGQIQFEQRAVILQQAEEFLDKVKNIKVNEETIKEAKKGAAIIRKRVNIIEDERIRVKKEILIPYNTLEAQIKEITSVLNEADSHIRDQVKDLEEKRRHEKLENIKKLFELRRIHYNFDYMTFDHFFKKEYLNQGFSMNKIELEIVNWLEKTKKEVNIIYDMEHSMDILCKYIEYQDLSSAIASVQKRQNDMKNMNEKVKETKVPRLFDTSLYVFFKSVRDRDLVISLIEQSEVDFRIV